MRTHQEFIERTKDYENLEYIYTKNGYIAWQVSTGENVQIMFIETRESRKGYGKMLIRLMCEVINPYHSVFVFRLKENKVAGHFYRNIGFEETEVKGVYRGDDAVVGVIEFKKLKEKLWENQ